MNNPALKEFPRYEMAPVLPSTSDASILGWLERSERLIARENTGPDYTSNTDQEIEGLMVDEGGYDEVDDSSDSSDDDYDGDE
jgi:hypothetical protein